MKFRNTTVLCLLVFVVSSIQVYAKQPERCGTKQLTDAEIATLEQQVERGKKGKTSDVIQTWVHVISAGPGFANGEVPESMIRAQIRVLNDSYNGRSGGANTSFGFELAGITRTENSNWFENFATSFAVEFEAKTALRRGGPGTLNVYLVNADPYLGWAYFPSILNTQYANLDGVVVDFRALPGGPYVFVSNGEVLDYAQGDTATHEVGHWLALYHTFDGCGTKGDFVADTPSERIPAFFCTAGRDTCPGKPGLDPIYNFMDYTADNCMYEFTVGQAERMQAAWAAFRD
jgi:hypothetical protein